MYYQFKVEAGQTIDVSLVGADKSNFDLHLISPDQKTILGSSTLGSYPEAVTYPGADAGTYYLQVKLVAGFGDFALFLAVAEYSGPGSSANEAIPIKPGTFDSELPGPSPESGIWYSFEVAAGQDIYLELGASEEDTDFGLSLFNPDQKLLGLTGEEAYPRSLTRLRAGAGNRNDEGPGNAGLLDPALLPPGGRRNRHYRICDWSLARHFGHLSDGTMGHRLQLYRRDGRGLSHIWHIPRGVESSSHAHRLCRWNRAQLCNSSDPCFQSPQNENHRLPEV